MDDAGLTDVYANAVTLSGTAARSATQSKFGGYSLAANGTAGYEKVNAYTFGTGDWTVEFWFFAPAFASGGYIMPIFQIGSALDGTDGLSIALYLDGTVRMHQAYSASVTLGTVTTGSWHHIAIIKYGATIKLAVNGTLSSGMTPVASFTSAKQIVLGSANVSNSQNQVVYIDEHRIRDFAQYTTNFTPPTTAFTE